MAKRARPDSGFPDDFSNALEEFAERMREEVDYRRRMVRLLFVVLSGGHIDRAQKLLTTMPTLERCLNKFVMERLTSAPRSFFALAAEGFLFLEACRVDYADIDMLRSSIDIPYLEEMIVAHAATRRAELLDDVPSGTLLSPQLLPLFDYATMLTHVNAPPAIVCSMHDIDAEKKVAFCRALTHLLVGDGTLQTSANICMEATMQLSAFFRSPENMPSADLCGVAHELLAHVMKLDKDQVIGLLSRSAALVDLLYAAPVESFLLDLYIDHHRDPLAAVEASYLGALLFDGVDDHTVLREHQELFAKLNAIALVFKSLMRDWPDRIRNLRLAARKYIEKDMRDPGVFAIDRVSLYPYQRATLQWMLERERMQRDQNFDFPGGIVSLEPGMGKTMVTLALIKCPIPNVRVAGRPLTLVIVPNAVLPDWEAENQQLFCSGQQLDFRICHVRDKKAVEKKRVDMEFKTAFGLARRYAKNNITTPCVIVTTIVTFLNLYDTLYDDKEEFTSLIGRLVIDESDEFKNAGGQYFRSLETAMLGVPLRWGLTGTPLRKDETDISGQLQMLGKKLSPKEDPVYVNEVRRRGIYLLEYGSNTIELPNVEEHMNTNALTVAEREFYQRTYQYLVKRYKQYDTLNDGERADSIKVVNVLRKSVVSLRQVPEADRKKYNQETLVEEVDKNDEMQPQSYFQMVTSYAMALATNKKGARRDAKEKIINGARNILGNAADIVNEDYVSSRIKAIETQILAIHHGHDSKTDKILVFSNFRGTLDEFLLHMTKMGDDHDFEIGYLDAGLNSAERLALRKRFLEVPRFKVLILTYQVGGAGLNLQAANHVFELDPSFTPADSKQALARARRLKQTKTVHRYRFVARGTFEQRIEELRGEKEREWERVKNTLSADQINAQNEEDEEVVLQRQLRDPTVVNAIFLAHGFNGTSN